MKNTIALICFAVLLSFGYIPSAMSQINSISYAKDDSHGYLADDSDRFSLELISPTTDGNENNEVNIYSYQKNIYIRFEECPEEKVLVSICDLLGEKKYSAQISDVINRISSDLLAGHYIVKILYKDKQYTEKILIK